MLAALSLARRGLGRVWPNPAVGCVIVRDGRVVGRGWTQTGGRPHAETEALVRAGSQARSATVYVSLEPCCHHGRTPPCTDALIAAGVGRVVAAIKDPDPRVDGAGLAALEKAGIATEVGLCADEARALNQGFFLRLAAGRPMVTLKTATTLDGRIATHRGESRWITGDLSRARAHLLRASHDAVMVGVGTAIADDPVLTCRLPGLSKHSPVRIVVDPRLRLPLTSRLVAGAREAPTWILTLGESERERRAAFVECGVEVLDVPGGPEHVMDLTAALRLLGRRGLNHVLVEGGAQLAGSLMRAKLVDRIVWFRAPRMMGGDGVPAAAAFGVDALADTAGFVRVTVGPVGDDVVEIYARRD